jgi:hypothetical protein
MYCAAVSDASVIPSPTPALVAAPMRRWRVALVLLLAAFIVGGHLYDIVTQREHWPFSFYPMYGRVQKKRQLSVLTLCLITRGEDGKRHMMRITDDKYVPGLGEARLRNILMAAWGRDGSQPGAVRKTREVLRAYLESYEANRVKRLHDGPAAIEAQLCRMTWPLKGDASSQKARTVESLLAVRIGEEPRRVKSAPTTAPTTPPTTSELEGDLRPPPPDPDDAPGD